MTRCDCVTRLRDANDTADVRRTTVVDEHDVRHINAPLGYVVPDGVLLVSGFHFDVVDSPASFESRVVQLL
jgi:hypothetical protein